MWTDKSTRVDRRLTIWTDRDIHGRQVRDSEAGRNTASRRGRAVAELAGCGRQAVPECCLWHDGIDGAIEEGSCSGLEEFDWKGRGQEEFTIDEERGQGGALKRECI
ncbi:unnamed protein product [Litomosoides sigmodontis]|uniref:Uncharacterized protein n=1 Tax=Litomosoides sigmodontis TaxID=42156 RepID=A0A3P6TBA7_LITSI|nr:unnamed protein product [Litomosoides sigmodontis]